MRAFRKLCNNLLTRRAATVLGPVQYVQYLTSVIAHIPTIIHKGDLRQVDEAVGAKVDRFRYRGANFRLDCRFCDQHIRDGSFAFGLAREIYIRDCYFRYHPRAVYAGAKTVVDLGANRGVFSVLMANRADFVLSVEAQAIFEPVIHHNMKSNGFSNYAVEIGFVGTGGSLSNPHPVSWTIEELLDRHALDRVDLIKIDIEGSEFPLFRSAAWLERVDAISMEVHPEHGEPQAILASLKQSGFAIKVASGDLVRTDDPATACFIYAWRGV